MIKDYLISNLEYIVMNHHQNVISIIGGSLWMVFIGLGVIVIYIYCLLIIEGKVLEG